MLYLRYLRRDLHTAHQNTDVDGTEIYKKTRFTLSLTKHKA